MKLTSKTASFLGSKIYFIKYLGENIDFESALTLQMEARELDFLLSYPRSQNCLS